MALALYLDHHVRREVAMMLRRRGVDVLTCWQDGTARDVEIARSAQEAVRREWCASEPEKRVDLAGGGSRFQRLHDFLKSGRLDVRALPAEMFGLVHGKAGVVVLADGRSTSFMGSANETRHAWQLNYELVWEDESRTAAARNGRCEATMAARRLHRVLAVLRLNLVARAATDPWPSVRGDDWHLCRQRKIRPASRRRVRARGARDDQGECENG